MKKRKPREWLICQAHARVWDRYDDSWCPFKNIGQHSLIRVREVLPRKKARRK